MDNLINLILDGAILVLLLGTMFFAARLSIYLKTFRDSRADLEKLLRDLSEQVDHAERAIDNLKDHARNTGRDLQGAVDDATHVRDELQIMNEYGDKVAARLERVLEKRDYSDTLDDVELPARDKSRNSEKATSRESDDESNDFQNMFKIRDIDVDRGETGSEGLFEEDLSDAEEFSSEAERELYNALKKKTNAGGA